MVHLYSSLPSISQDTALHSMRSEQPFLWTVSLVKAVTFDFFDRGETALHKAASHRYRTICRSLMNAGASLTQTDLEVRSVLQVKERA